MSCNTNAGVHITGKIIEMKKRPVKKSKTPVKVAEAKPKETRTKANAFSVNLTEEQRELVRTVTADLCVKGWSNYAIAKHISEVY